MEPFDVVGSFCATGFWLRVLSLPVELSALIGATGATAGAVVFPAVSTLESTSLRVAGVDDPRVDVELSAFVELPVEVLKATSPIVVLPMAGAVVGLVG